MCVNCSSGSLQWLLRHCLPQSERGDIWKKFALQQNTVSTSSTGACFAGIKVHTHLREGKMDRVYAFGQKNYEWHRTPASKSSISSVQFQISKRRMDVATTPCTGRQKQGNNLSSGSLALIRSYGDSVAVKLSLYSWQNAVSPRQHLLTEEGLAEEEETRAHIVPAWSVRVATRLGAANLTAQEQFAFIRYHPMARACLLVSQGKGGCMRGWCCVLLHV